MTSTRIIRPSSFKLTNVVKPNRPTWLPTPARLLQDKPVPGKDIGAKLVRPASRKAQTYLARSKGLRTSAGLEQQLLKEEGLKIRIGDKTLSELLQVEVPDTRKQEYIKADGSVGVRQVPVLDAAGNPVLVKKKLSIPGSIKHFQKSIKEKMTDIEQVLKDSKTDMDTKILTMTLLINSVMKTLKDAGFAPEEATDVIDQIQQMTEVLPLPSTPSGWGLPEIERLESGRFADSSYILDHLDILETQLVMVAPERGFPPGLQILKNEEGDLFSITELKLIPDGWVLDLNTSTVIDRRGEEEKKEVVAEPTEEPLIEEEKVAFVEPTEEPLIEEEKVAFVEPTEEERTLDVRSEFAQDTFNMLPLSDIIRTMKERGITIKEFNEGSDVQQSAIAATVMEALQEELGKRLEAEKLELAEREAKRFQDRRVGERILFFKEPELKGRVTDAELELLQDDLLVTRFRELDPLIRANLINFIQGTDPLDSEKLKRIARIFATDVKNIENIKADKIKSDIILRALDKTKFEEEEQDKKDIEEEEQDKKDIEEGTAVTPRELVRFGKQLSSEELIIMNELVDKGLKIPPLIIMPVRSLGTLKQIVIGEKSKGKTTATINKLLNLDVATLTDKQLDLIGRMLDFNIIIGKRPGSGFSAENIMMGTGHIRMTNEISLYKKMPIISFWNNFGYVRF